MYATNGEAKPETEDAWPNLLKKRRGPGCGSTLDHLIVAGGVSGWGEVLTSVEVFHIESKSLGKGGSMRQPRAFFKIIPIGSKHPRLLAIGGQSGTSILNTSEWWEEEEDSWQEGPALSAGRTNFDALMAPAQLVCPEKNSPTHSCPAVENNQTCLFPTTASGAPFFFLLESSHSSILSSGVYIFFEIGLPSSVCKKDGDVHICPTANTTCDPAKCPLQGPPRAPKVVPKQTG